MAQVFKSDVVNDVVVLDYSANEYAEYLKQKQGSEEYFRNPPEIKNALEGLRIMNVQSSDQSNLTRSPIETGVQISDSKVRMPRKISIKGICDNIRGEIITTKDTRSKINVGIPIIGGAINSVANGVVDSVMGYEYETTQQILTRARSVFKKIHKMYMDKTRINGSPKTWIISTKGSVYNNMILQSIEQLNDAEHLMVIPVTLNFEELMMVGQDTNDNVFLSDDDSPLSMGGSMKKGSIKDRAWEAVKGAFA